MKFPLPDAFLFRGGKPDRKPVLGIPEDRTPDLFSGVVLEIDPSRNQDVRIPVLVFDRECDLQPLPLRGESGRVLCLREEVWCHQECDQEGGKRFHFGHTIAVFARSSQLRNPPVIPVFLPDDGRSYLFFEQ